MSFSITKKELAHLAQLARLELEGKESERLLRDLQEIVTHVAQLQKVNTAGIAPMSGGTLLTNSFRDDGDTKNTNRGKGIEQFPEQESGYLKVPPVFKRDRT